ncbi:uncharacterized protein TNCV_2922251 [Trichonephila clavipes]|nr:uncharacterized protein TNCV_2922251 [Trichonephila clavipes]
MVIRHYSTVIEILEIQFQILVHHSEIQQKRTFSACGDSLERKSLNNTGNKLWPDLVGEKHFIDDHREEIADFIQLILGFQEYDEENVETWMTCDAKDSGFRMLNDDEIVTSVLEDFDPVDDETDENEYNNNNESNKISIKS